MFLSQREIIALIILALASSIEHMHRVYLTGRGLHLVHDSAETLEGCRQHTVRVGSEVRFAGVVIAAEAIQGAFTLAFIDGGLDLFGDAGPYSSVRVRVVCWAVLPALFSL